MTTPAGWYPANDQPGAERYWDGTAWTEQIRSIAGAPPQAPPPYQPAPQPKRTKHRKWPWVVAGLIVLIIIVSVATSSGGKKGDTANSGAAQEGATTASTATTRAAPPAAPRTLAVFTGSGTKKTKKFDVTSDDWTIAYRYDCTSFGSQGNFQVFVYGDDGMPDVAVNELAAKGTDTTEEHQGGSFYLEINSECAWTVRVLS